MVANDHRFSDWIGNAEEAASRSGFVDVLIGCLPDASESRSVERGEEFGGEFVNCIQRENGHSAEFSGQLLARRGGLIAGFSNA